MARDAGGRFLKGHHVSSEWKKGTHISPSTQFKKGVISPRKGKTNKRLFTCLQCSVEFSAWATRKYCSRTCVYSARTGSGSPLWKGGKRTERQKEMVRAKYRVWRDSVFQRDNYICQICGQYNGMLHADHIKDWALHPELRHDINNGRTLCRACHYYITFKRKMPLNSNWGITSVTEKRG